MGSPYLQAGEIYSASFPFGDRAEMKLRPVLLLTGPVGNGTETLVAYISSVVPATLPNSDILLDITETEYAFTGLKGTSLLRLHKLATIHTTSLKRRLGIISGATSVAVREKLNSMLNQLIEGNS